MDLDSLLVAVAAGDSNAFGLFYDELAPQVLGVAQHIIRDRTQAEEVTQEVFMELWRTAASFDPAQSSARSWALRLTRLRAIDRLRSDMAAKKRDTAEFVQQMTTWIAAEDEAVADLEAQEIRELVDSIGEPHRTAIMLAYFTGMSHAEVAEATGVPLGTAKTRVRDGMSKLRNALRVHASAGGAQ
ncbi:sigma-70 family RNA polymerase sigma factor [Corynebacterium epidermidicanis]|uniref:RNA polymerase sigma factor, sigma-70 family n=1 Tax=Corynebacterium epidermidicanis TaxID=1050174 RepID=A0A0G3GQY7_9CORY|nr:sigma-70 family RNA polymerase sigma factor [Corynebacterium epidermidicanis]AKK01983.1 RNA polymerase sigma factor, sigma-70 family [Corynebacterium epidermidicanis]